MIPTPPTTLPPTLPEKRKKKKRFTLPSNNGSCNSLEKSQVHDVQMIPFIHYGLDRNMTSFAVMDEDNILTHSPTLVSIGGTSFEIGVQSKLLILDLDPTGNSDGGLDTSYEFEWKTVETENEDILTFYNGYDNSNIGSIIYSKRKQSLYIFGKGWYQSWVACLDLKTLVWKRRNFKNRRNNVEIRFAMNYKNDEFICCSTIDYEGTACFNYFKYDELERIFELSDDISFHTLSNFKEFIVDDFMNISMRMFSPFSENMILTYDGYALCTMKLNENKKIPQTSIASEGVNSSVIELDSEHVLIVTEENLYKYNVNKKTSRVLSYSKPAFNLKFHKLFPPFVAKFKNRKNENLLIHIPNNDILYILKLDYNRPSRTFTKLLQECNYSDIIIKGQH